MRTYVVMLSRIQNKIVGTFKFIFQELFKEDTNAIMRETLYSHSITNPVTYPPVPQKPRDPTLAVDTLKYMNMLPNANHAKSSSTDSNASWIVKATFRTIE